MLDKMPMIEQALREKAAAKQKIYAHTQEAFSELRRISAGVAAHLSSVFPQKEHNLGIEHKDAGDFEFHLKFSGDLLIFSMTPHIITFPPEHILFKSNYIRESPARGFFGHITVYNFMSDTVKYNRLGDPGFLIARMLLNVDKKFYMEGVRQLNFLYPDIAVNDINPEVLKLFIESCMITAIDNDVIAPPYQDIQVINLQQKIAAQAGSGVQKVGFQMKHQG